MAATVVGLFLALGVGAKGHGALVWHAGLRSQAHHSAYVPPRAYLRVVCGQRAPRCVSCRGLPQATLRMDREAALRVLGLNSESHPSRREIKRAFRREVLRSHPDLHKGKHAGRFLEVKAAYEMLTGRSISAPTTAHPTRGFSGFANVDLGKPGKTASTPDELDELWVEIGYNPYTGEAVGPQDDGWYWDTTATVPPRQHQQSCPPMHATVTRMSVKRPPVAPAVGNKVTWEIVVFGTFLSLSLLALVSGSSTHPVRDEGGQGITPVIQSVPGTGGQGMAPRALPAVITGGQDTIPVSQTRTEAAAGLEYALAISTAGSSKVPVMPAGFVATPEMLQAWLTQPEQRDLQGFFPLSIQRGKLDSREAELLEKFWRSNGQYHRMRFLVDALVAALREPRTAGAGEGPRYSSVLVVAPNGILQGVANFLADTEGTVAVDVQSGSPLRQVAFAPLSARGVLRFRQAALGQEVLLVGTTPLQQLLGVGSAVGDPLRGAMPALHKLLRSTPLDLVVVDLSRPAAVELCEELSEQLDTNLLQGVDFLDPMTLKDFQPSSPTGIQAPGSVRTES